MTTTAERKAEEQQDRLEPGKGIASVMVRGMGTAKRKRGGGDSEDFDLMLNVSADIIEATPEKIGQLSKVSAIDQQIYIGDFANKATIATVSSKHGESKVTLVIQAGSVAAHAERICLLIEADEPVELFQAQLAMPTGDDEALPFDGSEANEDGEANEADP